MAALMVVLDLAGGAEGQRDVVTLIYLWGVTESNASPNT